MAISDLIAVISLSATILSLGIIIGERFSKNEKKQPQSIVPAINGCLTLFRD